MLSTLLAAVPAGHPSALQATSAIDSGDTAWVLTSAALVLVMTAPGLALFYGGMVQKKNALTTIMHSFICMALVILWEVASARDVQRLRGHKDCVYACAFSPDGRAVLSGSGDGALRLWDAATGQQVRALEGHVGTPTRSDPRGQDPQPRPQQVGGRWGWMAGSRPKAVQETPNAS